MNRHCIQFVVSFLVFVLGGVVGAVEFAGGTGEPNDPYLIATPEQLLEADFSVPGTYFKLCCDIDLRREGPIYSDICAHIDGAGFEIQNAVTTHGGVFGFVCEEGTITNVTLVNFDVGAALSDPGGIVGGMVGVNLGTISNCRAIGWISTSQIVQVGGLVGLNYGSIVNCCFDGWVGASCEVRSGDDADAVNPRIGGLVGSNLGLIANSFAEGVVVGQAGIGGLAGYNEGTINNCYATCMVIGDVGAGGLVADNWGSLRNCYARGEVMGRLRGGLVGMAGEYRGSAVNCLWDIRRTECPRSGAGMGFESLQNSWERMALNGWAGDPNWVMSIDDWSLNNYPRLTWEGTAGEVIPEYTWLPFWSGSGTQDDPYVIKTAQDLEDLRAASIYWDKHFVLANDLKYLASWGFIPIGVCSGSSFSGTFDGNGHVIRGLWVDASVSGGVVPEEATAWNLGLFGYVTGVVRNLILEDFHFTGGVHSRRVGLLAGTSEGVIENCSATGFIGVGEDGRFVGGLIGVDIGQVTDCEATVTIEAGEGSTDIGELVGASYPEM